MDALFYYVVHVVCVMLLLGYVFQGLAAPERGRRATLMASGILALLVFVAGFGLKAKVPHIEGWPLWLIGKIGCWLMLALLPGFAYRNPALAGVLKLVAVVLVATAVYLVYMKPAL